MDRTQARLAANGNRPLEDALNSLAVGPDKYLSPPGNVYICVKTSNADYPYYVDKYQKLYRNGTERVQTNFLTALGLMTHNDTVILTQGDWSGDNVTPVNATAAFCKVLGLPGSWLAPTSASTPALDVLARGWEISGLEFDASTTACGLRLRKAIGLVNRGADFFNVHHCLFYGGQGGIDINGGGTYWKIHDNHFSLATTVGKAGIYVSDSSYQVPALGEIHKNRFDNNVNHIHGGVSRGFSDTEIKGNSFQADGNGLNATVLMDIRGSGGGNSVLDNYWDLAKADFDAAATLVRANSTDYGAGNHFKDGDQTDPLGA